MQPNGNSLSALSVTETKLRQLKKDSKRLNEDVPSDHHILNACCLDKWKSIET